MVKFKVDDSNYNKIYPVGSIYMSINETNPSELFGGEWEQIKDKFLLACGTKHSNGSTGGSEDAVVVSHDHTQSAHSHGTKYNNYSFVVSETTGASNKRVTAVSSGSTYVNTASTNAFHHYNATDSQTPTINSKGESGTGKNMPPYLAVYVWVRIQ